MKPLITRILQVSIVACIVLLPSIAARADAATSTFQFSCVSFETLSYKKLFYREGSKYIPLEIKSRNRSKPVPLRGMNSLELYTSETSDGDKIEYVLVGRSALPLTKLALFLVFEKKGSDGLPLRLKGVDDSLSAFPTGTFRFANFTKNPLLFLFGGKKTMIEAGSLSVVPSRVDAEGGFLPFMIVDEKGQRVYENRLWSQVTGRDMVFIAPPARPGGRVSVMLLPQIVAPIAKSR